MKECSKSIMRRLADPRFSNAYFCGHGVDIGGKPDPLGLYQSLFSGMKTCKTWDLEDGDAQFMDSAEDASFDFVHSSHCLEHMMDPKVAILHWFRILKPAGHLILTVPDEDLYEQGVWPSTHNLDHKWSFSLFKNTSWCEQSISILELVQTLGEAADIRKLEVLDQSYRYDLPRYDQTRTPIAECGIEIIIRKRPQSELEAGGRLPASDLPDRETRIHLNQYVTDQQFLKTGNPPFLDDNWDEAT